MTIQYNVKEQQFLPYYGYESPAAKTTTSNNKKNDIWSTYGYNNKEQQAKATTDIVAVATLVSSTSAANPAEERTTTSTKACDADLRQRREEKIEQAENALVVSPKQARRRQKMTLEQRRWKKVEKQMTVLPPASLQVPKSKNPTGSDAVHPHRLAWKADRGAKTTAGAVTGAIVGGICAGPLFPVGMYLGAAAGGYAVNKVSKHGERKAQRKWEKTTFQKNCKQSMVVKYDAVFV